MLSLSHLDGLEQITQMYNKARAEFLAMKIDLFDPDDRQFDGFYEQLHHLLSDIDVRNPTDLRLADRSFSFSKSSTTSSTKISIAYCIRRHIIPLTH